MRVLLILHGCHAAVQHLVIPPVTGTCMSLPLAANGAPIRVCWVEHVMQCNVMCNVMHGACNSAVAVRQHSSPVKVLPLPLYGCCFFESFLGFCCNSKTCIMHDVEPEHVHALCHAVKKSSLLRSTGSFTSFASVQYDLQSLNVCCFAIICVVASTGTKSRAVRACVT